MFGHFYLFSFLLIIFSGIMVFYWGMIIGEIRERFEIENYLLTYREYFRRENFQAARFRRLTGRSLLSKSELIDFIAFYRVTQSHAPRKAATEQNMTMENPLLSGRDR